MHRGFGDDSHGRGLGYDLERIGQQMLARRRALTWFATAGAGSLLAGCGGGDGSSSTAATASAGSTTTGTTTGTTSTTTAATTTTTTNSQCLADPTETNGPYPADGTNTAPGSTSNVLTTSGVIRSDIRSSFIATSTVAVGVPLTLTLNLVNSSSGCVPLADYAIYIWHCDVNGNYSLYSGAVAESYLRGIQVTNASGQVTFTTIFPACYSGRWPHIHFEIYSGVAAATSGRNARLISQLAMPSDICTTVFNGDSRYASSIQSFRQASLASDNVFGDNTSAQIAAMTPAMSGSVAAGYTATATIGIAA